LGNGQFSPMSTVESGHFPAPQKRMSCCCTCMQSFFTICGIALVVASLFGPWFTMVLEGRSDCQPVSTKMFAQTASPEIQSDCFGDSLSNQATVQVFVNSATFCRFSPGEGGIHSQVDFTSDNPLKFGGLMALVGSCCAAGLALIAFVMSTVALRKPKVKCSMVFLQIVAFLAWVGAGALFGLKANDLFHEFNDTSGCDAEGRREFGDILSFWGIVAWVVGGVVFLLPSCCCICCGIRSATSADQSSALTSLESGQSYRGYPSGLQSVSSQSSFRHHSIHMDTPPTAGRYSRQ